jgi:YgiT-type zinc finger domain-containing protein
MEFNTCPLCGSSSIRKKKGVHQFNVRGEWLTTPVVQYWECPNCKEIFFDREANQKIDAALLPDRKAAREGVSRRKVTLKKKKLNRLD